MRQPTLRAAFRAAAAAGAPCTSCAVPMAAVRMSALATSTIAAPLRRAPLAYFSTSRPLSQEATEPPTPATETAETAETTAPPAGLAKILFPSSTPVLAGVVNSNPSVYATVYIHGRPYLVTPGDSVRLPFLMAGVQPGDELSLDQVGVVGSRTLTAVATSPGPRGGNSDASEGDVVRATVGAQAVALDTIPGASVRAVVLGVETEPERTLMKKKRRSRRKRTFKSKHSYTVLRIQGVTFQ